MKLLPVYKVPVPRSIPWSQLRYKVELAELITYDVIEYRLSHGHPVQFSSSGEEAVSMHRYVCFSCKMYSYAPDEDVCTDYLRSDEPLTEAAQQWMNRHARMHQYGANWWKGVNK